MPLQLISQGKEISIQRWTIGKQQEILLPPLVTRWSQILAKIFDIEFFEYVVNFPSINSMWWVISVYPHIVEFLGVLIRWLNNGPFFRCVPTVYESPCHWGGSNTVTSTPSPAILPSIFTSLTLYSYLKELTWALRALPLDCMSGNICRDNELWLKCHVSNTVDISWWDEMIVWMSTNLGVWERHCL